MSGTLTGKCPCESLGCVSGPELNSVSAVPCERARSLRHLGRRQVHAVAAVQPSAPGQGLSGMSARPSRTVTVLRILKPRAKLRWPNVANAVSGAVSPTQAMDTLAQQQDEVLARLQRFGIPGECRAELNPETDPAAWLAKPGAPKPKLTDERPRGRTVPYDGLIDAWRQGRTYCLDVFNHPLR